MRTRRRKGVAVSQPRPLCLSRPDSLGVMMLDLIVCGVAGAAIGVLAAAYGVAVFATAAMGSWAWVGMLWDSVVRSRSRVWASSGK